MVLMDTHCHFDFPAFDTKRESVLSECRQLGIRRLLVPGVKVATWSNCLALAEIHDEIDVALGLHPYFVSEHSKQDLELLEQHLLKNCAEISAVGEIGLDDTLDQFDLQCEYFEAQLDLAQKYELPVIMHMRRNHGHGLKRVRQRDLVGGVVHAFAGSFQDAMAWVELGMKIGVGGIITYARAKKTRDTIAKLPLSSLVLETDAPDMAIQGVERGHGSPVLMRKIFNALSDLRPESTEEIEQVLWSNSSSLFLPSSGQ